MPNLRPDLDSIPYYVPGRPIEDVAREHGLESIDKLVIVGHCSARPPRPGSREQVAHLVRKLFTR